MWPSSRIDQHNIYIFLVPTSIGGAILVYPFPRTTRLQPCSSELSLGEKFAFHRVQETHTKIIKIKILEMHTYNAEVNHIYSQWGHSRHCHTWKSLDFTFEKSWHNPIHLVRRKSASAQFGLRHHIHQPHCALQSKPSSSQQKKCWNINMGL